MIEERGVIVALGNETHSITAESPVSDGVGPQPRELTVGESQTARCQRIWQAHCRDPFDPLRAALRTSSRHASVAWRLSVFESTHGLLFTKC